MKVGDRGVKFDEGKPCAALLGDFGLALMAVADVATFGAEKYAPGGWLHVDDGRQRYTSALWRHLLAEPLCGFDDESGRRHAAHVAWNALARLELILRAENQGVKDVDGRSSDGNKSGLKPSY